MGTESKEIIIQTALEIIGQEGIHKITTREVAKRANVNIAALNYHFGTKDNLIRQALEVFMGTMGEAYSLLFNKELKPDQRLLAFMKRFAEISVKYPGAAKSLVGQMMWTETSNPVLAESQRRGIKSLTDSLQQLTGIQEEKTLLQLGLQIMSAIIYPVLLSKQLTDLYGLDYTVQAERDAYIESLFLQYVGEK